MSTKKMLYAREIERLENTSLAAPFIAGVTEAIDGVALGDVTPAVTFIQIGDSEAPNTCGETVVTCGNNVDSCQGGNSCAECSCDCTDAGACCPTYTFTCSGLQDLA